MILRRLAAAITEQNWFTVVLEVLIVVVGIFIGLQVDDWNEGRKERVQEQVYLERLLADLDQSLSVQEAELEYAILVFEMTGFLIEVIDQTTLAEDQVSHFNEALGHYGVFRSLRLNQGTMRELYSSGNLALIQDTAIRQAINNLQELLERQNQTAIAFRSRIAPNLYIFDTFVRILKTNTAEISVFQAEYDFDVMRSDTSFRQALYWGYNAASVFSDWQQRLYDATLETRNLVTVAIESSGEEVSQ